MAIGPHAESEAGVLEPHDLKRPVGDKIALTVVTPRGEIVARDVDEVIAPGETGELGVLRGHVPYLTTLKPGVLVIREGQKREILAVGTGYLQVAAGSRVHVLVDRAAAPDEIDEAAARDEKARLEQELAKASQSGAQADALHTDLAWAQARLDAKTRRG